MVLSTQEVAIEYKAGSMGGVVVAKKGKVPPPMTPSAERGIRLAKIIDDRYRHRTDFLEEVKEKTGEVILGTNLSDVINNKRGFGVERWAAVSETLGVPLFYLITGRNIEENGKEEIDPEEEQLLELFRAIRAPSLRSLIIDHATRIARENELLELSALNQQRILTFLEGKLSDADTRTIRRMIAAAVRS